MEKKYLEQAETVERAIKKLAENSDNLENLTRYLSYHFGDWLEKFANTPTDFAAEFESFANIKF